MSDKSDIRRNRPSKRGTATITADRESDEHPAGLEDEDAAAVVEEAARAAAAADWEASLEQARADVASVDELAQEAVEDWAEARERAAERAELEADAEPPAEEALAREALAEEALAEEALAEEALAEEALAEEALAEEALAEEAVAEEAVAEEAVAEEAVAEEAVAEEAVAEEAVAEEALAEEALAAEALAEEALAEEALAEEALAEEAARDADAAEEDLRALAEEAPTAEEELLSQAAEEADPEDEIIPAEIEEPEEEQSSSFERLAARAKRLNDDQVRHTLHSLLFVADKPLSPEQLRNATGLEPARIRAALERLGGELREGISGVVLSEVGGGWQLRTAPESAEFVRRFLQIKPRRLTRAALETLAIVAYRQPVTRPEIEEIRGVDCGAVLKALLEWKLLKILGKKDEAGRPLLYGTSREFLEFFQLKDLASLPSLREFHELNEESRQIIEEELGPDEVGSIDGTMAELADPAYVEAEKARAEKSEAALADLEQAMAAADEAATGVSESLNPTKADASADAEPDSEVAEGN